MSNPTVTGTSVLGMKFEGGVMLAADMIASYGSLARFLNAPRLLKVNNSTVLGAGGDYADYQYIQSLIEQKMISEECLDDGSNLTPKSLHCWLTRVMYARRTRLNPLWNTLVVAGVHNKQTYLGYVDMRGVAYESPTIASGLGAYIAQPLLRNAVERMGNMINEQLCRILMDQCLKLLYYRDARSFNKYQLATVTEDECRIEGPFSSATDFNIAHLVKGYE